MTQHVEERQHSTLGLILVLIASSLLLLGVAWYGISSEVLQRVWQDLTGRPSGPMSFRFFLQPAMAAIAAAHDGVRDAEFGRSPYFWTVWSDQNQRVGRLREGLVSTARIMLLGIAMDVVYQISFLKTFYPVEALVIAVALGFLPYMLLRGPFSRIARWWLGPRQKGSEP